MPSRETRIAPESADSAPESMYATTTVRWHVDAREPHRLVVAADRHGRASHRGAVEEELAAR